MFISKIYVIQISYRVLEDPEVNPLPKPKTTGYKVVNNFKDRRGYIYPYKVYMDISMCTLYMYDKDKS